MRLSSTLLTAFLIANTGLIASPGMGHTADLPSGFKDERGGKIVHVESGARFPAEVAGFRRTGVVSFDGQGDYVGVAYDRTLDDGAIVSLRIAIVHIEGMTPKEHFIIAKPMVLRDMDDVTTLSEGEYDRPGRGLDGYIGLYSAMNGGRKVGIGLWTFDRGYWDLRGRVEFPADRQAEAQKAVDAFVDAFVAVGQPYKTPKG